MPKMPSCSLTGLSTFREDEEMERGNCKEVHVLPRKPSEPEAALRDPRGCVEKGHQTGWMSLSSVPNANAGVG